MTTFLKRKITEAQSRDTGMAMVLIFLILFFIRKKETYLVLAIGLHIVNMAVPAIYKPVAVVWLALSDLLGAVASRVLMSLVFFAIVAPIGIIRCMAGRDSLKLRVFKTGQDSVMCEKNHLFSAADLEKPY